jgi:hypothetical protein
MAAAYRRGSPGLMQGKLQEIGPSIRPSPYLLERMFPRFREQLGTALDLIVEFSTLGEYRLGVDCAHGAASAPAVAPGHAPQLGGAGSPAGRAAVRRIVAGGATGRAPVATPAARRLLAAAAAADAVPLSAPEATQRTADPCRGDRRRPAVHRSTRTRPRSAPEQLCFAV